MGDDRIARFAASIVVLAFTNMSGDPEQEFFADGIAEDIITSLSKSRSLFVIARNSSFTYKGKAVATEKSAASSVCAMSSKAACARPAICARDGPADRSRYRRTPLG